MSHNCCSRQYTTYKGGCKWPWSRYSFHYITNEAANVCGMNDADSEEAASWLAPTCSSLNSPLAMSTDLITTGCPQHAANKTNIPTHMWTHRSTSPAEDAVRFQPLVSRFQTLAHNVANSSCRQKKKNRLNRLWIIARSGVHEIQWNMRWSERGLRKDDKMKRCSEELDMCDGSRHRKWKITNHWHHNSPPRKGVLSPFTAKQAI